MSSIKPQFASVELRDGAIHADVRVIFADKLDLQKTAKLRGWKDLESMPFTVSSFLAWRALVRTGQYTNNYDAFLGDLIDVQMDDERELAEADDASDPQLLPQAPSPEPWSPSL